MTDGRREKGDREREAKRKQTEEETKRKRQGQSQAAGGTGWHPITAAATKKRPLSRESAVRDIP